MMISIKKFASVAAIALASLALFTHASAQLIGNAGFEAPISNNPTGDWFKFGNAYQETQFVHGGTMALKMFGSFSGSFNVTGAYQNFAIAPGQSAAASVFAGTPSFDPMVGGGAPTSNWALLKLIYRDAANNDIVSAVSTNVDGTSPKDTFFYLTAAMGAAPANTDHGAIFLLYLQPMFDGGSCWFDDVSVAVGGSVTGNITLQGLLPSAGLPTFDANFYDHTSHALICTAPVQWDSSGNFLTVGPSAPGIYDMTIKVTHWLRQKVTIDMSSGSASGVTFSLVNGDVDGSNTVDGADYSLLLGTFGLLPGQAGYLAAADLNGDNQVDGGDYSILVANFGAVGD